MPTDLQAWAKDSVAGAKSGQPPKGSPGHKGTAAPPDGKATKGKTPGAFGKGKPGKGKPDGQHDETAEGETEAAKDPEGMSEWLDKLGEGHPKTAKWLGELGDAIRADDDTEIARVWGEAPVDESPEHDTDGEDEAGEDEAGGE